MIQRVAALTGGITVLLLVVASPVAHLDHHLLTAHMAQHLLLMLVAAPLILLGAYGWTLPQPPPRDLLVRGKLHHGNLLAHPCHFRVGFLNRISGTEWNRQAS